MDAAPLPRLIQFAHQQEATKGLAAASYTLLLYDIFLTLDEEKRHIWDTKPRFTLVKFLYYINRYFTPIPTFINLYVQFARTPTSTLCHFSTHFGSFSAIIIFSVVDAILMLRVWALYDRGRVMRWVLIFAMFCTVSGYLVILGISTPDIKYTHLSPLPGVITGCTQTAPLIYFFMFALTVFVEAVLFGMTLIKVLKHMRGDSTLPVIQYVFASGMLYFLVTLVACVFTIASHFIRVANPKIQLPGVNSYFIASISSIACSRLLLGIRDLSTPHTEPPPSLMVSPVPQTPSRREDIELACANTPHSAVAFRTFSDFDQDQDQDEDDGREYILAVFEAK